LLKVLGASGFSHPIIQIKIFSLLHVFKFGHNV
jgi:hypothetical protein